MSTKIDTFDIKKIKTIGGHEIHFNKSSNNSQNQIEIHTTNGQKISFIKQNNSNLEKIIITKSKDKLKDVDNYNNCIIIDPLENTLSVFGMEMDLNLKVKNLTIEASENINMNSKSTINIKGEKVCIN